MASSLATTLHASSIGMFFASQRIVRGVDTLQAIVQRDEGGRGIKPLTRPAQLRSVAAELMEVIRRQCTARAVAGTPSSVIVLTGFPCMRDRTPPTETDGPPGAACVARTVLALGAPSVQLPIEDHSEAALRACVRAACADDGAAAAIDVLGFPTADRWTAADDARLDALHAVATGVVSIERAGPAVDGTCYTMRALPMGAALVAPRLNELAQTASNPAASKHGARCFAIGDGGNELGLGDLHADVSAHVALGATIGCVVPAHAVLVASVSNWGAYALSHALSLLAWDAGLRPPALDAADAAAGTPEAEAYLDRLAPTPAAAERTILAANGAGLVDGITGLGGGAVDGMPLEVHAALVEELRRATLQSMRDSPFGAAPQDGRIHPDT